MPTLSTVSPPVNVEATQVSASAPVEVSWSLPSNGLATITAYRIFYGDGESALMPSFVTSIILSLNRDSVGETVSLRSEADLLTSQLINVTVHYYWSAKNTLYAVAKHVCTYLLPLTQPFQRTQQLKMFILSVLVPVL